MMTTILVVEDSLGARAAIQRLLAAAGYEVLEAPSAAVGARLAKEASPDLMLVDIRLGESMLGVTVSGIDLCRKVKTDPLTRHIPVVIMTSYGDRENITAAKAAYTDDFLVKPFESRVLLERIAKLIPKSAKNDELEKAPVKRLKSKTGKIIARQGAMDGKLAGLAATANLTAAFVSPGADLAGAISAGQTGLVVIDLDLEADPERLWQALRDTAPQLPILVVARPENREFIELIRGSDNGDYVLRPLRDQIALQKIRYFFDPSATPVASVGPATEPVSEAADPPLSNSESASSLEMPGAVEESEELSKEVPREPEISHREELRRRNRGTGLAAKLKRQRGDAPNE